MNRRQIKRRAGNAFIEFGLSATILFFCLAGVYQFGYSTYTYNRLESAVHGAARYAAFRTFRSANGATDLDKIKTSIKNYAVYGSPDASSGVPVAKDLTPAKIDVDFTTTPDGVPKTVRVKVKEYKLDVIFSEFTFTNKPAVTYPFVGRYAPKESEP